MLKIYWSEFYQDYLFLEGYILFLRMGVRYLPILYIDLINELEFICEVTDE